MTLPLPPDMPFFVALVRDAKSLGIDPEWFLRILYEESGVGANVGNALGYVGISQLSSTYLKNRRIDPADYLTWSASRQWTQVVYPWFKEQLGGRKPPSAGALYAFNLAPTTARNGSLAPDMVVLTGSAYQANKALRQWRDGGPDALLVSDLDTFLAKKGSEAPYKSLLALLAQARPTNIARWLWVAPAAIATAFFVLVVKGIRR